MSEDNKSAPVEILPDGVKVIRKLEPDEILLVTVTGGALTERSLELINSFINRCRDPAGDTTALVLEAEYLDELRTGPPVAIEVSIAKRDDLAKGIAIVEKEPSM